MGIRCPKCKGILSPHAKRCPEPDCGWSVVPEDSKAYQEDGPETVKEREWVTATREERLEIRFNEIAQRLATSELAIESLQDKVESLDKAALASILNIKRSLRQLEKPVECVDCPPACEQQPAAKFTVEQMGIAIDAASAVSYGQIADWALRALRAAKDRILAGKRSG